jgi:hypothetical protein
MSASILRRHGVAKAGPPCFVWLVAELQKGAVVLQAVGGI